MEKTEVCLNHAIAFLGSKGLKVCYSRTRGSNLAGNRCESVENAKKSGADYMLFIDDDIIFAPADIYNLWLHKADVVGGLYVKKYFPHTPNAAKFNPVNHSFDAFRKYPESGLMEVDGIGTGFMMIKMSIFDTIPSPWFCFMPHGLFEDYKKLFDAVRLQIPRMTGDVDIKDIKARLADVVGSVTPPAKDRGRVMGEDYYFCRRAQDFGFKVYVDCGTRVGHLGDYPFTIDEYYTVQAIEEAQRGGDATGGTNPPADSSKAVA